MQILTQYEREQIAFSLKLKRSTRDIATALGRTDHSVIVRELQRNRLSDGTYDPIRAQKKADLRAKKTNTRKLEEHWRLHDWVEGKLQKGWSPELIAGRLKEDPPRHLNGTTVSHEQIYDFIYHGNGRWEGWFHLLHRKHPKRRQQKGRKPKKTSIPERVSIHDRRTMSIRLQKVANKTAEEHEQALARTFDAVPEELRKTVTFDNGTENVCHTKIRETFHLDTFFCDAYAAWQKGGVENAIGLVRRYLPRTTDLATVSDADIAAIQDRLNDRPRKKLNYQTPNEALGGALNS